MAFNSTAINFSGNNSNFIDNPQTTWAHTVNVAYCFVPLNWVYTEPLYGVW